MSKTLSARPPSKFEILGLRMMIFIGILSMCVFLSVILSPGVADNRPLYILLIISLLFSCLRILYEWYHYFSITVPPTPPQTRSYSVDVFTTFCAGEPYEMIEETLRAAQEITYPHETYLCDEANDPHVKSLCAELGVHHVTRERKINAKAGNINNALARSTGELCVVLDPDHLPFPDFLDPIVSHFDDPNVGYVQIVQAYSNANESLIAKGAAQQTYQFYGPMMMTMHRYGTTLAIGANCTFRRAALDSIGGHAAGLAEDMHTSMQLHAKGWKSVYVPKVLARGLVPSTLSAYYKQQLKWSRGVLDLFVGVYPSLFKSFTWRQKLHYAAIPLHYMSGFAYLLNFLIPILSLFAGASPMHLDLLDFGIVLLPLGTALVMVRHFVQRWVMEDTERGFHVVGGLIMIGTWWVFILGIIYTLTGIKVPYDPTPKDGKEANNWPLNIPNLVIFGLSLSAIIYGLETDLNPYSIVMACFAGTNCLIMLFNVATSRQQQFRKLKARSGSLQKVMWILSETKGRFWLFRRRLYAGLRSLALFVVLISVLVMVYATSEKLNPEEHREYVAAQGANLFAPRHLAPGWSALLARIGDTTSFAKTPALSGTRGINYTKGSDWQHSSRVFTKDELVRDLSEMREAGANTIKYYGPSIYDHNVLRTAKANRIAVLYAFWIPEKTDFVNDKKNSQKLQGMILRTVRKYAGDSRIAGWNIGNDVLWGLSKYHRNNALFEQQKAYLLWLNALVIAIRKTGNKKPVSVDVTASPQLTSAARLVRHFVPQLNALGVRVNANYKQKGLPPLPYPYFFSYIDARTASKTITDKAGIFISRWQDEQTPGKTNLDGLKDYVGNRKAELLQLPKVWNNQPIALSVPMVKILKPALATYPGQTLTYHAIVRRRGEWSLARDTDFRFEWKLVQMDNHGTALDASDLGTGAEMKVTIPMQPSTYQLYLFVLKNNILVNTVTSTLNTPLPRN